LWLRAPCSRTPRASPGARRSARPAAAAARLANGGMDGGVSPLAPVSFRWRVPPGAARDIAGWRRSPPVCHAPAVERNPQKKPAASAYGLRA
jgi:hypothetical protein